MIRTLDPLLPKQVRYQAALYSVTPVAPDDVPRTRRGGDRMPRLITVPPKAFKQDIAQEIEQEIARKVAGGALLHGSAKACTNRRRWGVAKW